MSNSIKHPSSPWIATASTLRFVCTILLCLLSSGLFAANRYWVSSASSTWNNTANWSTSSGGSGGASVPASGDVAVFDGAGGNNGICTIDLAVNILGLSLTAGYSGAINQGIYSIVIGTNGAILSGGSFNGGSGSITVGNVFTISGTAFTSTTGILALATGANFNLLSGSFVHNTGTVVIHVANNTITGNVTFNHLTIHGNYGPYTFTIASGNTEIVNGNFTFSGNAGTWMNTGTIEARGDIIITNFSADGGGTATLLINGTGTQTLTGVASGMPGKLPKVTINKSAGTLNLADHISVANNWTYTAGTVNVGTSRIQFSGNLTITGTQTFNDVEFIAVNGGYTVVIEAASLLTANGTVYISGTQDLTIHTGTLEVKGNITSTNSSIYGGGSAIFLINGTGNQTVTGQATSHIGRLPKVTINKISGTLSLVSTVSVANNWTYTAGTVNAGTSRVAFSAALTISGTQTLNDVEFSSASFNGGSWYTIPSGHVITVQGTTYITGTASLYLNTGTVEAKGDIVITHSSTDGGGDGTILINGTGNQAFTSTTSAGQGRLPYLTIDKPSGTLTMSGYISVTRDWTYNQGTIDPGTSTIYFLNAQNIDAQGASSTMSFYNITLGDNNVRTLLGNVNINNVLSLATGKLRLNSNTCYMALASSLAVTRSTGYIISEAVNNSSKLSWNIGSTTGSYVYPFSTTTGSAYIPFVFELTSGDVGVVTVSTYPTASNNTPYPVSPDAVTNMSWNASPDFSSSVIDRFWQIDKTGASGTATITYTYAPAEISGGVTGNGSILYAQRYDASTNVWQNPRATQTANAAAYNVTETGITVFSPRMLGVHAVLLPVKLISFSATLKDNKHVDLRWATATENNNDHFFGGTLC